MITKINLFKDKILNVIKSQHRASMPYLTASEVGYCLVKSILRIKGIIPPHSDETLMIFSIGTANHEYLQKLLKDQLQSVESENVNHEIGLAGHCDGIYNDSIVEFKTCSLKNHNPDVLPYQSHVMQVHAYMLLFNKPKAIIIYIDKISGEIHEFEITRDEAIINEIKRRADLVRKVSKEPLENLKQYRNQLNLSESMCEYCNAIDFCPLVGGVDEPITD